MGLFGKEINDRLLKRNQNALMLMVGETGSGKSVNLASILNDIDPSFSLENLENRIAKSPLEFMELTDKMKKGELLMWDEAGIGLSSSEWWEQANILINYLLQTFRHENIGAAFTAPMMKDVDSKTRSRFHYILEVKKIDYKTNIAEVKIHRRKHNQLSGKTFYPRLRKTYGNVTFILQYIEVPLMPEDVLERYESIAKPWKRNLKADIKEQLSVLGKRIGFTDQEIVDKIVSSDYAEMVTNSGHKGLKIDKDIVEFKYGIGGKRSIRIVKAAKRAIKEKKLAAPSVNK